MKEYQSSPVAGWLTDRAKRTALLLILAFASLFFFQGCSAKPQLLYTLNGIWEYKQGFEENYLSGNDVTGWKRIEMPASVRNKDNLDSYQGMLTLRKELPQETDWYFENNYNMGFRTGTLSPAAEIYFNRSLIGRIGSLVPYRQGNDLELIALCRPEDYRKAAPNYIYFKLLINTDFTYVGLQGPELLLGPYDEVYTNYYQSIIRVFIIITIYTLVGGNFIFIGIRRPKELYNLYFGCFLLLLSLFYSINSEAKNFLFGTDSFFISKIDQLSLMPLAPLFILFISHRFHAKHTRLSLCLTLYFFILFVIDLFASQAVMSAVFNFWSVGIFAGSIYILYQTIILVIRKNMDAILILIGLCIALSGTVIDNLIALGIWHPISISIFHSMTVGKFLYIVVILCMAVLQSNRYVIVHEQLEALNVSLEQEVTQRTRELETALEQLKNKNSELEDAAVKDGLTGLFNHKMIYELLNSLYSSARHFHYSFSVIMIDIDKFKRINDEFGHQAGDRVIVMIANVLKSKLRQYDNKIKLDEKTEKSNADRFFREINPAGRYGGDEFVLLLPYCGKVDAMMIAERLHQIIDALVVEDIPGIKVTVSMGVCVMEDASITADMRRLISLADHALYLSKQQGRNRISCLDYKDSHPVE